MPTTPARLALVALVAACLLPVAPAVAQTVPAPPVPTTPATVRPQILVDRPVVDFGATLRLTVTGAAGAAVQLSGNGRVIRTVTIPSSGQFTWDLQPGDRTLFSADVAGVRTETLTVRVRRTVTIGVSRTGAVYAFTGQIARAEAGVQVTIARLDSETGRVTGIASTRTTADGRYDIRTSLPAGLAGYYALTGVNASLLEVGRSRLYGLLVNVRPSVATPDLTLGVVRVEGSYLFQGRLTPAQSTPITLARVVDGRPVGITSERTSATGLYIISVQLAPGTYQFQTVTAAAASRTYGLVVPALDRDRR